MFNPPPSFFEGLADRLQLATFDTNQEHRRMVKRRRLIEAAFVDGAMREPGYVFAADGSQGPHRRNDGEAFAYHPQFEEFEDNPARMSVIDRIKAKALEARQVGPNAIKSFEADLDALIAEGPKLKADQAAAVSKHTAAYKGIREQFDGLHSAIDILSNGGDPLEESPPAAPSSEAPKS